MEKAAFLMPVQGIIGRIEVENDLLGRRPVSLKEEFNEQTIDGRCVVADLVVTTRHQGACSSRFKVLLPASGA